jgi:hypothetical protein
MTTARNPAARDVAWGRWYARHGAARVIARTRRGIPQPSSNDERRQSYLLRLAAAGYDPREFARRAAHGAQVQDQVKARHTLSALLASINPDAAPPVIRTTRDNSAQPELAFTDQQVMAA